MKPPHRPPRNPWPLALVGVFAVFITLVAMFITFAMAQDMDLVRPDYYAHEIQFQNRIDSLSRTRQLSPPVRIRHDAARQLVEVSLPPDHAGARPAGTVRFYRPSDARLDRSVALNLDPSGRQSIPSASLQAGLWKINVEWHHRGLAYFATESVVLPKASP